MENKAEHDLNHEQAEMPDMPYGVSGFLAWLLLWFRLCLSGGRYRGDAPYWQNGQQQQADGRNRKQRRMDELHFASRPVPASRNLSFYYRYIRPGKTPGQFMEWMARYSGHGRVSVYRMRYWRKTVKGKAAPLGTEHEYWRDPLEPLGKHMSKLPCGVWAGHLWPEWPLANLFKPNITPRNASRVGIGVGQNKNIPISTLLSSRARPGISYFRRAWNTLHRRGPGSAMLCILAGMTKMIAYIQQQNWRYMSQFSMPKQLRGWALAYALVMHVLAGSRGIGRADGFRPCLTPDKTILTACL